jgi:hypothetical protein
MENEELRTRLLAMACEQVDIENALKAEVEALRKDAERYRHISEHLPIGTYADYEVSSKETWDSAIDAAAQLHHKEFARTV